MAMAMLYNYHYFLEPALTAGSRVSDLSGYARSHGIDVLRKKASALLPCIGFDGDGWPLIPRTFFSTALEMTVSIHI